MHIKDSIIIRTFNEAKHLGRVLQKIDRQHGRDDDREVLVVDSGSTDDTLAIAKSHGARVLHIPRAEFSFGRSLNRGCAAARGEYLVFISGHCIPVYDDWLGRLVEPFRQGRAAYIYGRQVGDDTSRFSERQHFSKHYPEQSAGLDQGFFCNNANAALRRSAWESHRFDEALTGLEDMELAQRLVQQGFEIGYVAGAPVYHLHNESWHKVRMRFEREAVALQKIMPQFQVGFVDFLRYFFSGVGGDVAAACRQGVLSKNASEIVLFRLMQYWGTYRGNHEHRLLTQRAKDAYFYPN